MPTFSTALNLALSNAATKVEWANIVKTYLGSTRRVRGFKDGVEFMNFASTGAFGVSSGNLIGFGTIGASTINNAVDLATGSSVLRIEGGGHSVEYTLGLAGNGTTGSREMLFSANPTGAAGVAFSASTGTKAPALLASGTGYAPPVLDVDAPSYVIIWDYSNESSPVEAGRIHFNNRINNWVFQDAEYAANIGDVRVTQSTESVIYGGFEFGSMLLSADPQLGSIANKVLHQVVCNFVPTAASWPSYPRQTGATGGGYSRGVRTINGVAHAYGLSNTFMQPFKVTIHKANGTLLGTIDMPKDNLPINSASLSDVFTKTKSIRPHTHCASMLVWNSHEPKLNSFRSKYFKGIDSNYLRPSLMKERSATNPAYPMQYVAQQDSLGQWYGVAKWALPCNNADVLADEAVRTDPYLWILGPNGSPANNPWATPAVASTFYGVDPSDYGSLTIAQALCMGWGYEPGGYCMHDQYSGPGGRRVDRAIIPTPIAIHMTDPNWVHLRDSTPITTMVKDWNMGYFNHAVHHFTDAKTFASIPVTECVRDSLWCYGNVYYNGINTFTTLDKTIPLFAIAGSPTSVPERPHFGAFVDFNNRMPWNGYSNDYFHNYSSPGWAALLYNSPAHALSCKMRYMGSIMAQALDTSPANLWKSFLVRNQAWLFFHDAMMWKLASDHPLGISRSMIEDRIAAGLMSMYTNIYVPLVDQNSQTMFFKAIRNFGIAVTYSSAYLGGCWYPQSFTLHYYMAHALQFWRQSGLWKVMYDRSPEIRKVLLMLIAALDKGSIDYYLDTDACYSGNVYNEGINLWVGPRTDSSQSTEIATSWADWLARVNPKAGPLEDCVHTSDGTLRQPDVGEHSRMQWPFIRRDYFPDIASSRDVNACCTKVLGWQNAWHSYIATLEGNGTSKRSIGVSDWAVHTALGRILPPDVLEP